MNPHQKTPFNEFMKRQARLTFFESEEFKKSEKARREASKPTEHIFMDGAKSRVYCPELDQIRPTWMCEYSCGDRTAEDYQPRDEERDDG